MLLLCGERVFSVRNRKGEWGLPGGKRDMDDDQSLFQTASREFSEETGHALPKMRFHHVQWGDDHHVIRLYYAWVAPEQAEGMEELLTTGSTPDKERSEVETAWKSGHWLVESKRCRAHIVKGLQLYQALVGPFPILQSQTSATNNDGSSGASVSDSGDKTGCDAINPGDDV